MMYDPLVAVVSYQDKAFHDSMGRFLTDNFQIEPVHFDFMTISTINRKNLDLYLVNSDAMGQDQKFVRNFQSVAARLNSGKNKYIIMLTKKIRASDFLRNLEITAMDTIDIGVGMDTLTDAMSRHLLERQLSLFEKVKAKRSRNMLK